MNRDRQTAYWVVSVTAAIVVIALAIFGAGSRNQETYLVGLGSVILAYNVLLFIKIAAMIYRRGLTRERPGTIMAWGPYVISIVSIWIFAGMANDLFIPPVEIKMLFVYLFFSVISMIVLGVFFFGIYLAGRFGKR